MARMISGTGEKVFSIKKWLGVNENPDGDTRLKLGEAAHMTNFRITDNGSLQKRPGSLNVAGLLSSYTITVSETAETVQEDVYSPTATFTAYPTISVSDGGILTLSGTSVTVTSDNITSYAGYYWQNTSGNIYQLGACTLIQPSTGTLVAGGSVTIATSTSRVYGIGDEVTECYSDIYVENGSVYGEGDYELLRWYDTVGKYVKTGGVYLIDSYNLYGDHFYRGYRVTWAGDDVYDWDFYPVTAEANSSDTQVRGIWSGYVGGAEHLVAACNGYVWDLTETDGVWAKDSIGTITTTGPVHFFGFGDKLYALNGSQYKVWDGTTYADVTGYRPLVSVAVPPAGGGTALQEVNKLNGYRRSWFSPTGTDTAFQLPETSVAGVDWVKNLTTDLNYTVTTDYSVDLTNGIVTFASGTSTENFTGTGSQTVFTLTNSNRYVVSITVAGTATTNYVYNIAEKTITFATAPASSAAIVVTETKVPGSGTDSIEIAWTCGTGTPDEVRAMKYSELYNGTTDNRVFLYGDGSNTALYSGLDYDGNPTAEYFPDLNEMEVGDTATPVTGLLRHYNRLLAFKEDCVFTISYGTITLTDGTVTAGFYLSPVNKGIGNCAPGQVLLVENYPRSLDGRSVYEWKPVGSGVITNDQRNAHRISQRIEQTLSGLDLTQAVAYFDKVNHEYYLMQGETMLVHNTENDTWYIYQDLPATCMTVYKDEVYFGTDDGYIRHFSRDYMHDNGEAISCYWESGSMDFGLDFKRKYSACLWVGLKPEAYGAVNVTVQTDRKTDFADEQAAADYTESVLSETAASGFFSFLDLDFTRLSFGINDKPQLSRLKIKAKKFAYYKLLLSTVSANTTATVTSADIRVRYAGNVR